MSLNYFCKVLLVTLFVTLIECRNYNIGLIFYDLKSYRAYLPPTVSVSRGRAINNVQYSSKGSIWSTFGKPCECQGLLCGCCAGLKVKQFNFDQKMCANITYAPQRNQLFLEVFFNEKPASRYGISARNPAPLCIPIMMNIPMAMCVQMSNIAVQGNNLNMCMDFVVRLASADLFEMHFQCMKMGLDGVQYVDKDGKPVIPMMNGATKSGNDYDEYYDDTAVNILPMQSNAAADANEPDDSDNEIDTNDNENDSENDNDNIDNESDNDNDRDENEIIAEPAVDSEMILGSKETNEVPKPITSALILEYTDEPTTTSIDQEVEDVEEVEIETEEEPLDEETEMTIIDNVTKLVTELSALETTTSSLIELPTTMPTSDYVTKQHAANVTQHVEPLEVVIPTNPELSALKPTNESLSVVEQVTKVIEASSSSAADKVQARRLKPHKSSKTHSKNIVPAMNTYSFYKRLFGFL